MKNTINLLDCFNENRDISIPLIALYECTEKKEDKVTGKVKYVTSYDQAYELVKDFSKLYSLDHLLVQTPKDDDLNFKYSKDKTTNTLVLKNGHDFPSELVQAGMNYDIFIKSVLNKIGNLRIYYRDKNSGRQNDAISLPENKNFYNYSNIKIRGTEMANILFDVCMPNYPIDIKNIDLGKEEKTTKKFLDMNDFFELGELTAGDKVYITLKPVQSTATLVDSKYVIYNGEKMTINEWGCKVTGWKSIRIYEYMAKLGEGETLQEKRIRIEKDNISNLD